MIIKSNLFKNSILYCFLTLLLSCNNNPKKIFSFDESQNKAQYLTKEILNLNIKNIENKHIDSVVYYVNTINVGKTVGLKPFSFDLKDQRLGVFKIKALVFFENKNEVLNTDFEIITDVVPTLYKYEIVNTYPHNTTSFTEGLEFHNGILYEGTGSKGLSKLLKTDYKTGEILNAVPINDTLFGEGISILKDKIYQLTWQSRIGFVYDLKTMKLEKTFKYDKDNEGWGMANDGEYLYHNDSTEVIWKMNPKTLKMVDSIKVYTGASKVRRLNELEYVDGKFYSNIWQKPSIAIINAKTGAVEGVLDLADLEKKVTNPTKDVLNGIAYKKDSKTFFVTGKNWDKMFEIKILK